MSNNIQTRITLPEEVHRQVKAEAARHGIRVAEALGMCVAFLCDVTTPLLWRVKIEDVADDLESYADEIRLTP